MKSFSFVLVSLTSCSFLFACETQNIEPSGSTEVLDVLTSGVVPEVNMSITCTGSVCMMMMQTPATRGELLFTTTDFSVDGGSMAPQSNFQITAMKLPQEEPLTVTPLHVIHDNQDWLKIDIADLSCGGIQFKASVNGITPTINFYNYCGLTAQSGGAGGNTSP